MFFSVLMSVYYKEKPDFFSQALESLWDHQSIRPNEIILVEDGLLSDELYKVITEWEKKLKGILKRVVLKENQGLGHALNIGLKYCQYDYVARMDTDDICTNDRFEKQIHFLVSNPEVDILGGQIMEFDTYPSDACLKRQLPTGHESIVSFAKFRCPFSHPSVIYKKSSVVKAGGYRDDYLYEDYALWVRMICDNAIVANLPNVVLYMRSGDDMLRRRGGKRYAINEVKAQYNFFLLGFLSTFELIRNLLVRLPIRLMPNLLRSFIYKKFLREKS